MDAYFLCSAAYVQEIARCGRDGQPGKAILFFNRSDVAKNVSHLDDTMRQFVLTKECRRKYMVDYFVFELRSLAKNMSCDNCKMSTEQMEEVVPAPTEEMFTSDNMKQQATEMLSKYFEAENSILQGALLPSLVAGLTDSLIESISSSLKYCDPEYISHEFPHLKDSYVRNISKIMSVGSVG